MEMSKKIRRQLWLQSWGFVVLFLSVIALVAILGERYNLQLDWTASGRHTLSEATQQLLHKLDDKVEITAFTRSVGESELSKRTKDLIERYQKIKPDIVLTFIDPDQEPTLVREKGITLDGELVVSYQNRTENLKTLGEQALTNTLQRLMRSSAQQVLFISGHGERRFDGEANHDMQQWAERLQKQGISFDSINLAVDMQIPTDSVVVLASPQTALLPGEIEILRQYIADGGDLLWLRDPDDGLDLQPLADALGIRFLPGTLIDPTGRLLGIEHPAFILVAEYPQHPVAENLTTLTLFPIAQAITTAENADITWQQTDLLRSLDRSWVETSPLQGEIGFDEQSDTAGPQTLGMLLSREVATKAAQTASTDSTDASDKPADAPKQQQRIAIIGDGDFLSNAYIGNGANIELGSRLINWLGHDDSMISIPSKAAPDTALVLTQTSSTLISVGFLILLPLLLIGSGGWIWWRRRNA